MPEISKELMGSLVRDEGWTEMGVYQSEREPEFADFLKTIDDEARNLNKVAVLHPADSAKKGKLSSATENRKS